jgi:copper chaperone CopZ
MCESSVADIEKALHAKGGVGSMEVDVHSGRVIVGYDSKQINPEQIAAAIDGLGYRDKVSEVLSVEQFRAQTGREPGIKTKTLGCAGGCGAREAKGE